MNDRDHDLYADMLQYGRDAVAIVGALEPAGLLADRIRYLAACRAVEIIGEAASKVSDEGRRALPGFPWREAINMRHILIHDYGRIQADIVVQTVRDDLPGLISDLEKLLQEAQKP